MGVSTSTPSYAYDQLYLPADCFRPCHPSSCFCNGRHHSHSRSKYVYIERNNPYSYNSPYNNHTPSREIYRDPADCIDRFFPPTGGGAAYNAAPPPPGWAPPHHWRPRDYDVLSRVLGQVMAQQRGITEVPWAEMSMPSPYAYCPPAPMAGGWGYPWGGWTPPWLNAGAGGADMDFGGGGGSGNGRKRMMAELVEEATKAQNERVKELFDKLQDVNDCLFGSAAEMREKRFEQSMLRHLQPLVPELAKLIAVQQMGLGLGGQGMGGLGALPGGGGAAGMGGLGGIGMGMGMPGMQGLNPFAGMGGMGPMMNPFGMPGGGMPGMNPMMGGEPGFMAGAGDMGGGMGRRRNRGRRAVRDMEFDDDDDDLDFGRGRSRFGRRKGRRGGGRYDDLDDLFGDRGGDGEYVGPA